MSTKSPPIRNQPPSTPTMSSPSQGAPSHGNPAHLLPPTYKRLIASWLEEDTPSFDYGGFVVGEAPAEALLLGKSAVSRIDMQYSGSAEDIVGVLIFWEGDSGGSAVFRRGV